MTLLRTLPALLALGALAACSGGGSDATVTGYAIQASSGGALTAIAGDAIKLVVVQTMSDGTTSALPSGASVTWTAPALVTSVSADDATDSTPNPIPAYGASPTAIFISNSRTDRAADLTGVLFVLDQGTAGSESVAVTATVAGASPGGTANGSVSVSGPIPAGDANRGGTLYGASGANCAACHGNSGEGSTASADGSYTIDGRPYDFPAPPLNAASTDNLAADPGWNAALLAMSARSDVDNGGIELRAPMPDFLSESNPATGKPLDAQDFADIYAFLQTQTQQ